MINMNTITATPSNAPDTAATTRSTRKSDILEKDVPEKPSGFDVLLGSKNTRGFQQAVAKDVDETLVPEIDEDTKTEMVDESVVPVAASVSDQPLPANAILPFEPKSAGSAPANPRPGDRSGPHRTLLTAISTLKLQTQQTKDEPESADQALKDAGTSGASALDATNTVKSLPADASPLPSKNRKPDSALRDNAVGAQEQARPPASSGQASPAVPVLQQAGQLASAATARPTETQPGFRLQVSDVQILSERSFGVAKTLHIRLEPIELGTVMARMRIVPEGMQIELTAERRETAELLARDKEALGRALHLAGLGDDKVVAISIADRNGSATSNQASNQTFNGQDQSFGRGAHQSSTGAQDQHRSDSGSGRQNTYSGGATDGGEIETPRPATNLPSSRGLVV
ncbi:MAG: flagellar hook-length control protein FliK [Phyllobacterium sp.]